MTSASEPSESSTDTEPAEASSKIRAKKADETWKERAQQEKEKLAGKADRERPRAPPASLLGLLEELAVRAMLGLGQIQDPISGEASINLEGAKYAIDLLGILEAKTKGNVDSTESAAMKDLLQNLRLSFVQISKNPPTPEELLAASQARAAGGGNRSDTETAAPPKIVL